MEQRDRATSGRAVVNGAPLYYEVNGSGPALLLLHAGVADSRMWDDQFDEFSRTYRVVRFDLRGFGRSGMPAGSFSNLEDVRGLLEFLHIGEVYLVGISFGSLIALDFTLAYPEYVRALVLGAPSVSGSKPSERIRKFWDQEGSALESGDLEGATELNLELWVDGPHRAVGEVSPHVREKVKEMQLAIFQKEVPDDVEEIGLNPPAIGRLGEIEVPVQVMVGDQDLNEKLDLAETLVSGISNCTKVIIPGAAHMLNMEKPQAFNRNVLDFLAAH